MRGLPLTFPATTGCDEPMTGGVLNKPKGAR
jgi:1,6-anhydro-N-acetylmuramate kinase